MQLTRHTPDALRLARHQSLELYGAPHHGVSEEVAAELGEIARLARLVTSADGAMVQMLPAGRQVTLAATSPECPLDLPEELSVCARLLEQRPVYAVNVEDLAADPRFRDNPFVDGRWAAVRGWGSAPLVGAERVPLGTVCVYFSVPRVLGRDERSLLDQLARAAVKVLDDVRRSRRVEPAAPHPVAAVA